MNKLQNKKMVFSLAIVAIAIGVAGFFAWLGAQQNKLELSGLVQAKEVKNASLFGGRVQDILVEEGANVKEGQALVKFDGISLTSKIDEAQAAVSQAKSKAQLLAEGADVSQLRQAQAQVAQAEERLRMLTNGARPEELAQVQAKLQAAQAQYESARKGWESAQTMLEEGIISQQKHTELHNAYNTALSNLNAAKASVQMAKTPARAEELRIAKAQLTAAQAQYDALAKGAKPEELTIAKESVNQAKSNLNALTGQLQEVTIKSPIAGIVSVISVSKGELVQPGRPVVSVIDYDNLWTDVYVPESKLSYVKVGQPVTVRAEAHPGKVFRGKVAVINPKGEFVPSSGGSNVSEESTFRVKVLVNNRDTQGDTPLLPGMKVDVLFTR